MQTIFCKELISLHEKKVGLLSDDNIQIQVLGSLMVQHLLKLMGFFFQEQFKTSEHLHGGGGNYWRHIPYLPER